MRALLSVLLLAACGSSPEAPKAQEDPPQDPPTAEAKAKPDAQAPKARVMFLEPKDGAVVTSPVHLKFGVEGMAVRPAGEVVEGTGHHHVIIGPAGVAKGDVVPADETHIHFGKGQTEADIELPPGEHQLTMQFADGSHTSYGDVLATTITITVEE